MDLLDFVRGLQGSFDRHGRQTYIMYHGTTLQNALEIVKGGFTPSSNGMLGRGVYVSRSFQKASAYPKILYRGEEPVVLKLRVRVGRVIRINCQNHPLQKSWHQAGYDTAWVPPNCGMVGSGLEENCVWDPKRIEVLDILNQGGSSKNFSAFGFMPDLNWSACPMPAAFNFPSAPSMLPLVRVPYPTPIPPPYWATCPTTSPCPSSLPCPPPFIFPEMFMFPPF